MVLSNAPIVLFAIDRNGVFTLSEGRGLERLGLQRGEVVGRQVAEVYKDDSAGARERAPRTPPASISARSTTSGRRRSRRHHAPIRTAMAS